MKIERILAGWDDYQIKVVTDEDLEDMKWAVIVSDHGDEFLYVYMNNGRKYQYGMFCNLKNYESTIKPTLCKEPIIFDEEKDGINGIAGKKDITENDYFDFDDIVRVFKVKEEELDINESERVDEWGYFTKWISFDWDPERLANKIFYEKFNELLTDFSQKFYMLEDETRISKDGTAYYLMQWFNDDTGIPYAGYYTLDEVKMLRDNSR